MTWSHKNWWSSIQFNSIWIQHGAHLVVKEWLCKLQLTTDAFFSLATLTIPDHRLNGNWINCSSVVDELNVEWCMSAGPGVLELLRCLLLRDLIFIRARREVNSLRLFEEEKIERLNEGYILQGQGLLGAASLDWPRCCIISCYYSKQTPMLQIRHHSLANIPFKPRRRLSLNR